MIRVKLNRKPIFFANEKLDNPLISLPLPELFSEKSWEHYPLILFSTQRRAKFAKAQRKGMPHANRSLA